MENLVKEIILHRKSVLIGIVVLLLGFAGYIVNKHIVTVTDYSNGGAEKRIFVFDLSTVKKVPNYAKDKGYELVYKRDYDKYHQGYCLKENRILSDEEIFRRGIKEFLDKKRQLEEKISISYFGGRLPVKYYLISGVNARNWYEKFTENHFWATKSGLKEMLFNTFKAKPVDNVMDYVTIDMKSMAASFKKPIALSNRGGNYDIYVEKSFLLYKSGDEYAVKYNWVDLISGRKIWISDKKYQEKFQKKAGKRDGFDGWHRNIDHCGNIEFNIEKEFSQSLQGG